MALTSVTNKLNPGWLGIEHFGLSKFTYRMIYFLSSFNSIHLAADHPVNIINLTSLTQITDPNMGLRNDL